MRIRGTSLVLAAAALLAATLPAAAAAQGKYGAIAFNKGSRAYGYSFNQPTRIAAENRALAECGAGCASMLWYANGCGAMAISKERYGAGGAPSRTEAQELAHIEATSLMFPFDEPHLFAPLRQVWLEKLRADPRQQFARLSDQVARDESVWTRLADYVERHRSAFQAP